MPDAAESSASWHTAWTSIKRYWHWPVLLAVAVYAYQQYLPSIDLSTVERPAPEVVARTMDGERFRLQDYRGKVVVVNVWATWCPPCRVEMPGFVDLQREWGDAGVQFVGIAVDRGGDEAVRPFVEEKGVNFPQIVDPGLAARHFPGEVVPRTYLIDKQGRIRYRHTGVLLKWALDDALETLAEEAGPEGT
jgi:peroxiredoxin